MEKITARKGSAMDKYPEKIEKLYEDIYNELDEKMKEDLSYLIDLTYGAGYIDGMRDILLISDGL